MADARRAELLATLARSTATAAAALVEQARAYAELAQLEQDDRRMSKRQTQIAR